MKSFDTLPEGGSVMNFRVNTWKEGDKRKNTGIQQELGGPFLSTPAVTPLPGPLAATLLPASYLPGGFAWLFKFCPADAKKVTVLLGARAALNPKPHALISISCALNAYNGAVYKDQAAPVEEVFREAGLLHSYELTQGIPQTLPRLLEFVRPFCKHADQPQRGAPGGGGVDGKKAAAATAATRAEAGLWERAVWCLMNEETPWFDCARPVRTTRLLSALTDETHHVNHNLRGQSCHPL
eukprot:450755-Pelagomonas_calceolata.AAC.8